MFDDAEAAGVWVNSADDIEHCSFILPAIHRDGAITVAVSTEGQSPAFAAWLRDRVRDAWPPVGLADVAAQIAEERLPCTNAARPPRGSTGLRESTSCR